MLKEIRDCFQSDKFLFSQHARDEMDTEEPYPSCLLYGRTSENRPLHIVCAYSREENMVIVITVYQPDPEKWIDFERRKT
jgi:hypothetical protein